MQFRKYIFNKMEIPQDIFDFLEEKKNPVKVFHITGHPLTFMSSKQVWTVPWFQGI